VRYATGERVQLGDTIELTGSLRGTIVCVIDDGQYTAEYPEANWAYLQRGALIQTSEAGLVHCDDESELFLIERSHPTQSGTGNADAVP
jgi:hypothetical protein